MKKSSGLVFKLYLPGLIILAALLLRIIGLDYGFPQLLHPDETTSVRRALIFYRDGFNPHWFSMPTFYLYLLHGLYRLLPGLGLIGGDPSAVPRPPEVRLACYLIARWISAILGTVTVAMVYLTGKKLYSRRTGLGAAFLLAGLPAHVLLSHYGTVDVPVTCFISVSFFFSALVLKKRKWGHYLGAGFFAGLAAGTKYNGVFALFPLIGAHLIGRRDKPFLRRFVDPRLFTAVLLAAAVFLAATPYLLTNLERFGSDLRAQSDYLIRYGHGPIFISTGPGFIYQAGYVLYYMGGIVFQLMVCFGLIYSLVRRRPADLLIFCWIIPYFILISIPTVKFARFFLPLLPFLALLSGRLLTIEWKTSRRNWIFRSVWAAGACWIFLQGIGIADLLRRPDIRITAGRWLEDNISSRHRIGLIRTETGLVFLDDPVIRTGPGYPTIKQYKRLLPALRDEPEYIIATNFDYRQILRLREKYDIKRARRWEKFLAGDLGYRKVKDFQNDPAFLFFRFGGSFPPHDLIYNRPRIQVFARESAR